MDGTLTIGHLGLVTLVAQVSNLQTGILAGGHANEEG